MSKLRCRDRDHPFVVSRTGADRVYLEADIPPVGYLKLVGIAFTACSVCPVGVNLPIGCYTNLEIIG